MVPIRNTMNRIRNTIFWISVIQILLGIFYPARRKTSAFRPGI